MADIHQESYIPIFYDSWELLRSDLDNSRHLNVQEQMVLYVPR